MANTPTGGQTDNQSPPYSGSSDEAPLALKNKFLPTVPNTDCARNAFAVSLDDNNDLMQFAYRGLLAASAGVVKVDMVGGGRGILVPIAAGILCPVQARRIYNSGTTATGIVALF